MMPPSIARARLRLWAFWCGTVVTLAALTAVIRATDGRFVELCPARGTAVFECVSDPSPLPPPWKALAIFAVVAATIEVSWRLRMNKLRGRGEIVVVEDAPLGYRQAPPQRRRLEEQAAFTAATKPTEVRMAATFGLAHALLFIRWSMTRPIRSFGSVGPASLGLEHPGWIWGVALPIAIVLLAQVPIRRRIVGPIADLIEPLRQRAL
jgi:hypothetical protein